MRTNMAATAPVPAGTLRTDAVLAAKLLSAWAANRRQTLMPHTLNLRALERGEADALIAVMAAAAQSGGSVDDAARDRAARALALVGADADEMRRHAAALAVPQPVSAVLEEVCARHLGPRAFAAALLAADRASPAAAAFLRYLACRLSLPPDLAAALESRYRA